jgi:hypothetical protein
MGIILAAFFFGMITLGFTLLTVMPLVLVWLMVGVYFETRSQAASDEPRSTSVGSGGQKALTPSEDLVGAGR